MVNQGKMKAIHWIEGCGFVKNHISILFFMGLFLLNTFTVTSQEFDNSPYAGTWVFTRGEVQEKVFETNAGFLNRNIESLHELRDYTYFDNAPVMLDMEVLGEIGLVNVMMSGSIRMGGRFILVEEGRETILHVLTPAPGMEQENIMELGFENLHTAASYRNVQLSGNTLSLQYEYMYKNSNGQLIDGLLTIYFKK